MTVSPESGRAPTWRSGFAFPARGRAERRAARHEDGIVALDHVQVAAPPGCEDEAWRFYGQLLGLAEIEKPPTLAARGGVCSASARRSSTSGLRSPSRRRRRRIPRFGSTPVAELGELAGRLLEAQDVEVRWADPSEIPGVTRFSSTTRGGTGSSCSRPDWRMRTRRPVGRRCEADDHLAHRRGAHRAGVGSRTPKRASVGAREVGTNLTRKP